MTDSSTSMSTTTDEDDTDDRRTAAEMVEAIDAGELDPEDVDPHELAYRSDTTLSPALAERVSEEQIEAFAEAQDEKISESFAERQQELAEETKEKLEILDEVVTDEDDQLTATVELGEAELVVPTRIPGAVEERIDRLDSLDEGADRAEAVETAIETILHLIVDDDEPDGSEHTWRDRETWEAFYQRHGSEGLSTILELLTEPARERQDRLQSFRDDERGAGNTTDV